MTCFSNVSYNRIKNGNKCECKSRFFDNGSVSCDSCNYSCLTCNGTEANNCSSCDSSLEFRNLDNSTCSCQDGYYNNGSNPVCQTCHFSCLTCNNPGSNSCVSCDSSNFREKIGT